MALAVNTLGCTSITRSPHIAAVVGCGGDVDCSAPHPDRAAEGNSEDVNTFVLADPMYSRESHASAHLGGHQCTDANIINIARMMNDFFFDLSSGRP